MQNVFYKIRDNSKEKYFDKNFQRRIKRFDYN